MGGAAHHRAPQPQPMSSWNQRVGHTVATPVWPPKSIAHSASPAYLNQQRGFCPGGCMRRVAAVLLWCCWAPSVAQAQQWDVYNLPLVGQDMNNHGQIVGSRPGAGGSWLWSEGGLTYLGDELFPNDINDNRAVVGGPYGGASLGNGGHAWLWFGGQQVILPGLTSWPTGETYAATITNGNAVVGWAQHRDPLFPNFFVRRAVQWFGGGITELAPTLNSQLSPIQLPPAPDARQFNSEVILGTDGVLVGTRDTGQMVNEFGRQYWTSGGGYQWLTTGFFPSSSPGAINAQGMVAGSYLDPDTGRTHCAVFDTAVRVLPNEHPTDTGCLAFGINDDGAVVGQVQVGTSRRAFIYVPAPMYGLAMGMHTLENLLTSTVHNLVFGRTINNHGQILVGFEFFTGSAMSTLLLSPVGYVPSPAPNDTYGYFPYANADSDPVNTFNGELFTHGHEDLSLRGPMPLAFTRRYASSVTPAQVPDARLGAGWSHNFAWRLEINGNDLTVRTDRGAALQFVDDAGTIRAVTARHKLLSLARSGADFWLVDRDHRQAHVFDATGRLTRVEDLLGNAHSVSYDGQGRISQVDDGLGRVLTFLYDAGGLLQSVGDGVRTVAFQHTGGLLTRATLPGNEAWNYTYSAGRLQSVTRPRGNTPLVTTYDAYGRVVQQTDVLGGSTTIRYALDGTHVTAGQTVTTHRHSLTGALTELKRGSGSGNGGRSGFNGSNERTEFRNSGNVRSAFTYTPEGYPLAVTDETMNTTTLGYASRAGAAGVDFSDVTSVTYPDGVQKTFAHDANGLVTSVVDRAGATWSYTHNARGQVLTVTHALGGVTTSVYGANGLRTGVTYPHRGAFTMTHTPAGDIERITRAGNATVQFTYDANRRPLTVTDELGNTTAHLYDANGNLTRVTDRSGRQQRMVYDALDRVTRVEDDVGGMDITYGTDGRPASMSWGTRSLSVTRDARGYVTQLLDGEGQPWATEYDAFGRRSMVTDPLGQQVRYTYDLRHRLVSVSHPTSQKTLSHDARGNLTRIEDSAGEATTFEYDNGNALTRITAPGNLVSEMGRNAVGLLTTFRNAALAQWTNAYDNVGRLISRLDPLGRELRLAYAPTGEVSTVTYPDNSTQTITRDLGGRVTQRTYSDGLVIPLTLDEEGRTLTAPSLALTYNARGQVASSNGLVMEHTVAGDLAAVTYAPGKRVTYLTDGNGHPTQVQDWLGGVTTLTWDAAGQLTSVLHVNGVLTTYGRDSAGQIFSIEDTRDGNSLSFIYVGRGPGGRITEMTRSLPLAVTLPSSSTAFPADAANQLTTATHDGQGRVVSHGASTFTWDGASRLTSVTLGGQTITYAHDGNGALVQRSTPGSVVEYVWNYAYRLPQVATTRVNGTDESHLVRLPDGRLLYSVDAAGNRTHFHFDDLGHTSHLTNGSGAVTDMFRYSPYGRLLARSGSTVTPFLFGGESGLITDAAAGLIHMRARVYAPATARFLSQDARLSAVHPRWTNQYAYAIGDPLRFLDVTGQIPGFPWEEAPKDRDEERADVYENAGEVFGFGKERVESLAETRQNFFEDNARNDLIYPEDRFIKPVDSKAVETSTRSGKLGQALHYGGTALTAAEHANTAVTFADTWLSKGFEPAMKDLGKSMFEDRVDDAIKQHTKLGGPAKEVWQTRQDIIAEKSETLDNHGLALGTLDRQLAEMLKNQQKGRITPEEAERQFKDIMSSFDDSISGATTRGEAGIQYEATTGGISAVLAYINPF